MKEWSKRSNKEKGLIIVGSSLVATAIGFGLYYLGKKAGIDLGSRVKTKDVSDSLSQIFDKGVEVGFDKGVRDPLSNLSIAKTHAFRAGLKEGVVTGRFQELYHFTEPNLGDPDQAFMLKMFGAKIIKVSRAEAESILSHVDAIKEMEKFLRTQIDKGMEY